VAIHQVAIHQDANDQLPGHLEAGSSAAPKAPAPCSRPCCRIKPVAPVGHKVAFDNDLQQSVSVVATVAPLSELQPALAFAPVTESFPPTCSLQILHCQWQC
jgi:hypothetical protein